VIMNNHLDLDNDKHSIKMYIIFYCKKN
jgi:hypothetical protein